MRRRIGLVCAPLAAKTASNNSDSAWQARQERNRNFTDDTLPELLRENKIGERAGNAICCRFKEGLTFFRFWRLIPTEMVPVKLTDVTPNGVPSQQSAALKKEAPWLVEGGSDPDKSGQGDGLRVEGRLETPKGLIA